MVAVTLHDPRRATEFDKRRCHRNMDRNGPLDRTITARVAYRREAQSCVRGHPSAAPRLATCRAPGTES